MSGKQRIVDGLRRAGNAAATRTQMTTEEFRAPMKEDLLSFFLKQEFLQLILPETLRERGIVVAANDDAFLFLRRGIVSRAFLRAYFTLLFYYNKTVELPGYSFAAHLFNLVNLHRDGNIHHWQLTAQQCGDYLVRDDFLRLITDTTHSVSVRCDVATEILEGNLAAAVKEVNEVVDARKPASLPTWSELVLYASCVVDEQHTICDTCHTHYEYFLHVNDASFTEQREKIFFCMPMSPKDAYAVIDRFSRDIPVGVACTPSLVNLQMQGDLSVILDKLRSIVISVLSGK